MRKILPFVFSCLLVSSSLFAQVDFSDQTNLLTTTNVESSHPCAVTDMNGDGLDDIVRLDGGIDLYVNYQNANGTFTEFHFGDIESGGWGGDAWGMCIADVDNNGRPDVLAGGAYDDLKVVLAGNVDGDFTITEISASGIFLQGVNFFDIDYDGDVDIFACHDDGASQLLMNDGNGNFSEGMFDGIFNTSLYGGDEDNSGNYGSVWSDVNGDHRADCYIAKCRQGVTDPTDVRRINQLWMYNTADGTYYEYGEESGTDIGWQSWSADFADIDNDGDMDMFVGNHDYTNQLFENQGNGIFTDISDVSGIEDVFNSIVIQSIFRDFDNDGWIDILITGGDEYAIGINNGDNTFTAANSPFGNYGMNSFACGDLNNDGYVDVYGSAGGYGSQGSQDVDAMFFNEESGNNFIEVKLEATESAPQGIGAIIIVETSLGTQMREVRSGESYGIQNSLTAHFGLGSSIDPTVTVYWPSGLTDQLSLNENEINTVVEGSFPSQISPINQIESIAVYPNPSSGTISLTNPIDGIAGIKLFDASGRLVKNFNYNGGMILIEKGNIESGVYQLQIEHTNGKTSITKVVFN